MRTTGRILAGGLAAALLLSSLPARAGQGLHVTWLWHLEQPIYWPAPNASGLRYQSARDSIQARRAGAAHPLNDLDQIFGLDDRKAAYQYRPRDSLRTLLGHPEAGAQVSYSGGLIFNIASLGGANQLGYGPDWNAAFREAQGWQTSGGKPRLDIVQFPFHHTLLPLADPAVVAMELALYREIYGQTWSAAAMSRGLFPSEMAFSERLIPALRAAGIDWVVVSNSHLSRACEGYPFVPGAGGDNIPPPNRADVQNPAQANWNRLRIDRGVSPANAYPFAYRPHHARYVDPETGAASQIVVVPAAQSESWQDGYACYGTRDMDVYAGTSDPAHPILVLLAHDGDNAFGGGFSYYQECVANLANAAAAKGYRPTTVGQYLADHPVDATDVVHVEDGAWVNADGDFGAPSFLNWNWPLMGNGSVDIANGWAEDERNWAVLTAATDYVKTASALRGAPVVAKVLHPEQGGSLVEQAWHFLLGGFNSGYMYYGKSLDMELKPVVASNEAVRRATQAVGGSWAGERTGPTVWIPQRYPDNPGSENFGPLYRYRLEVMPTTTWFWTFVHDVSGTASVTLKVRVDKDGRNPLSDDDNDTYAGGAGVEGWQSFPMTRRLFPKGNVTNDPEIDDSILPDAIADEYWVKVDGFRSQLLDYHVEAVDMAGNRTRSPIQHVYVGSGAGATNPNGPVRWEPQNPTTADVIRVSADKPGKLHWGVNGWKLVDVAHRPAGTTEFGNGKAVETPLAGPDGEGRYAVALGPFGEPQTVTVVDFVVHRDDGSWDNNGGRDYHIAVSALVDGGSPPAPDASVESDADGGPDASIEAADAGEDGSVGVDAASLEPCDGSIAPRADAGASSSDAGEPAPGESGCGCASGGGAAWLLLIGLVRRRGSSSRPRRRAR